MRNHYFFIQFIFQMDSDTELDPNVTVTKDYAPTHLLILGGGHAGR